MPTDWIVTRTIEEKVTANTPEEAVAETSLILAGSAKVTNLRLRPDYSNRVHGAMINGESPQVAVARMARR